MFWTSPGHNMTTPRLRQFQEISALLNSSLRHDEIRTRAIQAAMTLVEAEAGSLLLLDEPTGELHFDVAHGEKGDSVRSVRLKPGEGIAGSVLKTGEPVLINNVQHDPRFSSLADRRSGFATRNMICVPITARGERLGVLQVLNKSQDRLFNEDDLHECIALGHQVGIAVENANLYRDIQNLFDGFVSASVQAIESRDPITSGHSLRVAHLTCRLAEVVSQSRSGPYATLLFDEAQLKEMHYAAVLHDFGKVGVREHLLVKANKLYPGQLAVLQTRFDFIKRTLEVHSLRRQVELLRAGHRPDIESALADLETNLQTRLHQVDEMLAHLQTCNQPTLHPQEALTRLQEIACLSYESYDGDHTYLTPEEVTALSIPTGSLTRDERTAIETHVSHTYQFLRKIPWTRSLHQVPDIAHAHHEYLDGSGYPRRITAQDIPVQSRIMTICDIYDALTAADRPYKKAVTPMKALEILAQKATNKQIDGDLFALFTDAKVYQMTSPSRDSAP